MFNVIGKISSNLSNMAKKTIKSRSLTKDDIIGLIRQNSELHQDLVYVLDALNHNENSKQWYYDAVLGLKKTSPKLSEALTTYTSKLKSKAATAESRSIFGALQDCNKKYIKILDVVESNIDELILEEKVTIYETRVSLLAVIGFIKQSTMVANFTTYLYSYLMESTTGDVSKIPGYRLKFMIDNAATIADIVNSVLNKNGDYDFLNDIKRMRSDAADWVVGADASLPATTNALTIGIFDYLLSALSCLNIFSIGLNAWDDYCISRNNKNKETKAWLETHTAVLRLKLSGVNENDPAYAKQLKIIEAYDRMITDYDAEIKAFEEG